MRKNCRLTYDAWRDGRAVEPSPSIWTDGATVYSYQTAIAVRRPSGVLLNRTPYSRTTTTHQNALAVQLYSDAVAYLEVWDVPRDTQHLFHRLSTKENQTL